MVDRVPLVCGCPRVFLLPLRPSTALVLEGIEIGPFMSDQHIRILTAQARHSQHQLDVHAGADGQPGPEFAGRRRELEGRAGRTRTRVAAARARRS
jgi:hypothetical protein